MRAPRGVAYSNSEAIPSDLIQAELERIIASSAFDVSRRNRAFLRFIVEETLAGRGDRIKAYTIGTSVLERDETFDSQADPIVRIEASRLRRSLERYYLIAGQGDSIRIEIPKGAYVPTFRRLHSIQDESAAPQDAPGWGFPPGQPPILAGRPEARTRRPGIYISLRSGRVIARGAWAAAALGTVAIALAIGLSVWHQTTEPEAVVAEPAGRGPSIIVLPFDNLSDEPAKAYLAGGLTEEILTSLAQFEELFVYGHETGARYGSATDYRELHRELGVRYVLEGSVREAEGRIRVTARLVDATIGARLWASAYEEVASGADLFQIQSDIARRVAVEVAQPYGIIAAADLQLVRGKTPQTLSAYECVLQVLDYYRHMSAARVEEARSCLERATESDPEYADPWALLGMSYLDQIRLRMAPRSRDKELLDRALQDAQRAADIAPDSALAQRSLLLVHSFRGEVEQALAAGERAITLSPNNAEILAEFGMRLALMGQWERGVSLIDEAIARNPAHLRQLLGGAPERKRGQHALADGLGAARAHGCGRGRERGGRVRHRLSEGGLASGWQMGRGAVQRGRLPARVLPPLPRLQCLFSAVGARPLPEPHGQERPPRGLGDMNREPRRPPGAFVIWLTTPKLAERSAQASS